MASDISKYTKNNQHWVSSSVRPFAFFVIRLPSFILCPSPFVVCPLHTLLQSLVPQGARRC